MKNLVARCAMCPARNGTPTFDCLLFRRDLITGDTYPCKFVKVFTDSAGRLFRVCKREASGLYKTFFRTGSGTPWKPLPTKLLPWRCSFDKAQMDLNFYAARKGWKPVWPVPEACGEPEETHQNTEDTKA